MTRYHCKGGRVMKDKREFQIAMVLVGLVGVNFFWIFEVFFRGLGDALFRWHGGDVIDWMTVAAIILANIVALACSTTTRASTPRPSRSTSGRWRSGRRPWGRSIPKWPRA